MIFRLSQKVSARIKAGTLAALPVDENPFADWSAHLFSADRTQYIIICNTKSLYSTVMYAKGITTTTFSSPERSVVFGNSWKTTAKSSSISG